MNHQNWNNLFKLCICNLFLLLLNLQDCSNGAFTLGGSSVKFLPGFDGPLPFELETGYIGIGESEDVQLFYYFIESERNPAKDPILLWLSGGPGCSALSGLLYEIGPIKFVLLDYNGSLPKLVLNPYSWTKVASIIFLDIPVGTGFSYARNTKAAKSDDLQSSDHAYEFLRKWQVDHPRFISNQFYIGGGSYSGITVPILTQLISDGNDVGLEPKIDLKGYVLGNPVTSLLADSDYVVPFALGMGLISDELFESLKETCRGKYHDVDPENIHCLRNMQTLDELLGNINRGSILDPNCPVDVPKPDKLFGDTRRIMYEKYRLDLIKLELHKDSPFKCRNDEDMISYWTNDENVQEAIHVRKGTIGEWKTCNFDLPYTEFVANVVSYHANLSIKGYRSLIFSGDHDMIVPFISTEAWIKSLNYSIVDDWRPWIVDGQVGGYTRTYSNRMTFATVKGTGHIAPEFKPRECRAMFERWISYQPL